MKTNFFGSVEIKAAFGFEIEASAIPPIPYSQAELKRAKDLGENLILRVSQDEDGQAMTMQHINELMEPILAKDKAGKLLYDPSWYKDEAFFKDSPLKTEWQLVGTKFVPASINQNYLHQTKALRQYLETVDSLSADEKAECSDKDLQLLSNEMGVDWDTQAITDNEKYEKNWKNVAQKLSNLKINQNHRRTPKEILYDWVLQFKKSGRRGLLENNYDLSNTLSSDGKFVNVGRVDSGGARVIRWRPGSRDGDLGVVSLR